MNRSPLSLRYRLALVSQEPAGRDTCRSWGRRDETDESGDTAGKSSTGESLPCGATGDLPGVNSRGDVSVVRPRSMLLRYLEKNFPLEGSSAAIHKPPLGGLVDLLVFTHNSAHEHADARPLYHRCGDAKTALYQASACFGTMLAVSQSHDYT